MNIKLSRIWKRNKTSAYPVTITEAPDASGAWIKTEVLGDPVIGVKYNTSSSERYFLQTWASDVTEVFVTDDPGDLTAKSILRISGTDYAVDSVVEAMDEGIYNIALRLHE